MPLGDWSAADAIAKQVLADHCGVARINAFLSAGLTRHQVAAIFRRGLMERPRNAWFVDPEIPWEGKHAVRVGGVLACVSAAEAWGLPVPPDRNRRLHVAVASGASHLRHNRDRTWEVKAGDDAEVQLHWTALLRPAVGWRTSLVDTLLQLVDCVPEEWFVAALDAALHQPWEGEPILSNADYETFAGLLPRRKRRLLRLVNPLAGSCLETLLRLGLERRAIGPVTLQFSPDGRRFVDLLVGDRLIVEADGEAFHDPAQDAVRDAFFQALGYVVLRFSYEEIVFHLDEVLDRIVDALAHL
jgi:very-short-patch-repair endonuclease